LNPTCRFGKTHHANTTQKRFNFLSPPNVPVTSPIARQLKLARPHPLFVLFSFVLLRFKSAISNGVTPRHHLPVEVETISSTQRKQSIMLVNVETLASHRTPADQPPQQPPRLLSASPFVSAPTAFLAPFRSVNALHAHLSTSHDETVTIENARAAHDIGDASRWNEKPQYNTHDQYAKTE